MRTSEQIDQVSVALTAAQLEIEAAPKDKTNPHFKSRYADLASVWDACRAALGKHGLAVIQSPSTTPERFLRMTTRIIHKSGQWLESDIDLKPAQDTPQAIGSAITYARRYALSSMVGVVSEEDDDGNAASFKPNNNHPKIPTPPPKPQPQMPALPQQYNHADPACRKWLWEETLKVNPGVEAEECGKLSEKINGLDFKAIPQVIKEYFHLLDKG